MWPFTKKEDPWGPKARARYRKHCRLQWSTYNSKTEKSKLISQAKAKKMVGATKAAKMRRYACDEGEAWTKVRGLTVTAQWSKKPM